MTSAPTSDTGGADTADHRRSDRARSWALVAAVAVLIGTWLLLTPPNAGPDEAGHLVRGVAVIDGEPGSAAVEAPLWIVFPDIGCYALFSDRPASCAPVGDEPVAEGVLVTRAWDYPIWGHVLPGLALEISTAATSPYVPRVVSAMVPLVLLVAGLWVAARRSPVAGAAALLAITPTAWFTFAVVNPSGPAIAGAFAVWTVMLFAPTQPRRPAADVSWPVRYQWLFAIGLAAAILPRRDSVFWAAAVLVAASVATGSPVLTRLRHLSVGPAVTLALAVAASAWWAFDNGVQTLGLFVLSVGSVVAHDVWRGMRSSVADGRERWVDAAAVAGLVGVAVVLVTTREGGYDSELMTTVIGESGSNLLEAIGAVGTLDARIPLWALVVYVVSVVSLAVLSVIAAESSAFPGGPTRATVLTPVATGVGVLVVAVVAAWALEMARGNTTGTYWQGRYSLPLLMGVPMLFGAPLVSPAGALAPRVRSVAAAVAGVATLLSVVMFVVALRRWGVGTSGSWNPTDWDTFGAPVPTTALVVVHAGAAAVAAWAVVSAPTRSVAPGGPPGSAPTPGTTVAADADR